jgi:hypothetical protein
MTRLTKAQRETLRQMFDGRCAYCGEPLPDRWHADHVQAVIRELTIMETNRGTYRVVSGKPSRPELDVVSNFMPACPPCNNSKASMSLEHWRAWLAGHIDSLNAYSSVYRMVKKFGLVQETAALVVFHFERTEVQTRPSGGQSSKTEIT